MNFCSDDCDSNGCDSACDSNGCDSNGHGGLFGHGAGHGGHGHFGGFLSGHGKGAGNGNHHGHQGLVSALLGGGLQHCLGGHGNGHGSHGHTVGGNGLLHRGAGLGHLHGHHGFGLLSRLHQGPYGGEIPHTANAAGMYGLQGGNPAPTYAYPYYTTRGPRDFLADGCGAPPIAPYNPRPPLCLPSIGW